MKQTIQRVRLILLTLLSIALLLAACNKGINETPSNLTDVSYSVDFSKFGNPERGFYRHTESQMGKGINLNKSTLEGYRKAGNSLILRVFYLKDFRNQELSQAALEDFDKDMDVVRQAGVKAIVRFAYSQAEKEPDAPLTSIQMHMKQLKPLLEKHCDVIATVQAGLIGAWGEWYYTSNNLNNAVARRAVIDALLEAVPQRRTVQLQGFPDCADYSRSDGNRIFRIFRINLREETENERTRNYNGSCHRRRSRSDYRRALRRCQRKV